MAELGQKALSGMDLQSLMEHAAVLVAQALDVEYTKILELLPDEKELLLRGEQAVRDRGPGGSRLASAGDELTRY